MFDPTINEMKFEYEEAFLPNVLVEWIKPDPNETPRAGRMINDKWPIEVDDMLKKATHCTSNQESSLEVCIQKQQA
jgi:hypothetical protein